MKALLSNDDGYLSPALSELHRICQKHFDHIDVVAPDRNCSGVSSCLTLRHAIYTHQHDSGFISVEGTPTDCVYLGLLNLFEHSFDMVLSGINLGPNLGDDVVYSGTVAAAIEGRFLDYPSLAISMNSEKPVHYETAEYVIDRIITQVKANPPQAQTLLNINIPDIPLAELKGIKVTRLSYRHQGKPAKETFIRHGQQAFWIGPPGKIADQSEGTDYHAIQNNYASVTPLNMDLTHHKELVNISEWLDQDLEHNLG